MIILKDQGIIDSATLIERGIDRKTIQRLCDSGDILRIARGIYQDPEYIPSEHHSLLVAQLILKKGVVCLLSSLSFHEIGTQNPSAVWMALDRKNWKPQKLEAVPMEVVRFSNAALLEGIKEIEIESRPVRVYNIPKTVVDCFKYRNKVGLEVAMEALKDVITHKRTSIDELLYYADICRMKKIMAPYLESIL